MKLIIIIGESQSRAISYKPVLSNDHLFANKNRDEIHLVASIDILDACIGFLGLLNHSNNVFLYDLFNIIFMFSTKGFTG